MKYDAVLVPGGGIADGFTPPLWVKNRLDRAFAERGDGFIITLSAGTTHKPPPLNPQGFPIHESVVSAKYLLEKGVPPSKLLTETCSFDTIGNAFFARVIHVSPRQLMNLLVVTSEFHMPRTETIFRWVFSLDADPNSRRLSFVAVPDIGIEANALRERMEKESKSLADVRELEIQIKSLVQLHEWLFTQHKAYSNLDPNAFGAESTPPGISTY